MRATRAERTATKEAENAQAVNDFLNNDLLAAVAPSTEKGKGVNVMMHDVLDAASKRIDAASRPGGRFADKPLIEASIRDTLGRTFNELGLGAQAEPHLARAVEVRRAQQGPEHPRTLGTMHNLAVDHHEQGKYADAQRMCEQTLEIERRVLGPQGPLTLQSMNNGGICYYDQRKYADAERLFAQTVEIARRVRGPEHAETLTSMGNLANAYLEQGKLAEAEALYRAALMTRRKVSGSAHPETNRLRSNLIEFYRSQDRLDDAQSLIEEQKIASARARADKRGASAKTLNKTARGLLAVEPADLRDPAAGLAYATRAVQASGEKDGGIMDTLALTYHLTGDHERAVETEQRALALLPPGDSPTRQEFEANLAKFRRAAASQPAASQPARTIRSGSEER